jgi:chemotaxis response regulator CheB
MTTPQTPENASLQNETSQSETPINETVQSEAVPQSSTPVQQSAVAGSGGTTAASSDMGTATSNPDGASPHKPVAVVGLGASAGGIKVLQELLGGLPAIAGWRLWS